MEDLQHNVTIIITFIVIHNKHRFFFFLVLNLIDMKLITKLSMNCIENKGNKNYVKKMILFSIDI
jgi:hypothetical protein